MKINLSLLVIVAISIIIGFSLGKIYFNKKHLLTNQKNKEVVLLLIDQIWNKGDFENLDQLIAPEYTIRHDPGDPWEGQTIDPATFKERVLISRSVLPDQKFHIEDIVSEDNKVAISWKFTGTQTGDHPQLPATNKAVNISGLTIYYLSNGKITGHWQVLDKLRLFEQLGIHASSKN